MAPSFTFKNFDHNLDEAALVQHLQDEYQMPSRDWWSGANAAFEKLRAMLDMNPYPEEEPPSTTEPEGISARAARASALPSVTTKKIGSHLLQVTLTNEPLFCIAFGNTTPSLYSDILWEAVAIAKAEAKAEISVYEARNGNFELSLDGYAFTLRYVQCNDFLKSYPDVTSAPQSFLRDPENHFFHVCDIVEALKADARHLHNDHIRTIQTSYYYIRAWAQARGLMGISGFGCTSSKEILAILFDYTLSYETYPSPSLTNYLTHFMRAFDAKCGTSEPSILGVQPYPENTSKGWLDLLQNLQSLPLRKMMSFPYYFQISVTFTCSGMRGGQWVSMLEERLSNIPDIGFGPQKKYRVWPNRLVAADEVRDSVYEGFYIVGVEAPEVKIGSSVLADVLMKLKYRVEKDKDSVEGQCFLDILTKTVSEFDTVFKTCRREWPRKPLADPNENNAARFDKPILIRAKKVGKDGRKNSKVLAPPPVLIEQKLSLPMHPELLHVKLRPASDVLARLKYDPSLDIDEFVVAYEDRHTSKLQEKPAASWQRDTTHEEFIPEHRIVYFKRIQKGTIDEIVWDRRSKADLIFKEDKEAGERSP